jgi:hypothetical protein
LEQTKLLFAFVALLFRALGPISFLGIAAHNRG